MPKNKLVIRVPPGFMFTAVEQDKIRKTKWEVKTGSDQIVRHTPCVPLFGTRGVVEGR